MEVWKPVPGYEKHYEVSNRGAVRSIDRRILNSSGPGYRLMKGRDLKYGRHQAGRKGYYVVRLSKNGIVTCFSVHQLVLTAFRGPAPMPGMECRHLDGNELNNRLRNLQWGTKKENQADRKLHGTGNNGERNHFSKITNDDVFKIREMSEEGFTCKEIAEKMSLTYVIVRDVLSGRTWTHL